VLDAGIRSLSRKAIERAQERGLAVFRSETRAGYISEIECALITRELFQSVVGSRVLEGTRIVAGGIIGERGDIVVDSVTQPERVYGVADGAGGLIDPPSDDGRDRMERIARHCGASLRPY